MEEQLSQCRRDLISSQEAEAVLLSNLPPRVQPEMLEGLLRGYSWAETGPVVVCSGSAGPLGLFCNLELLQLSYWIPAEYKFL